MNILENNNNNNNRKFIHQAKGVIYTIVYEVGFGSVENWQEKAVVDLLKRQLLTCWKSSCWLVELLYSLIKEQKPVYIMVTKWFAY